MQDRISSATAISTTRMTVHLVPAHTLPLLPPPPPAKLPPPLPVLRTVSLAAAGPCALGTPVLPPSWVGLAQQALHQAKATLRAQGGRWRRVHTGCTDIINR